MVGRALDIGGKGVRRDLAIRSSVLGAHTGSVRRVLCLPCQHLFFCSSKVSTFEYLCRAAARAPPPWATAAGCRTLPAQMHSDSVEYGAVRSSTHNGHAPKP